MSTRDLENTLRNLTSVGTLVKDHAYRQIWRFEHDGRAYYLKFWPGDVSFLRRLVHPNQAIREFQRLQWLQKGNIPAPRAVAVLMGLRIGGRKGDAVVLEAIEPSINLADHAQACKLQGKPIDGHRQIADQITGIIQQLARANLRHTDLHLGNFLLSNGKIYLLDAYAVKKGLPHMADLLMLAHGVRDFASRTDLVRAWRALTPDAPMPRRNARSAGLWKTFYKRTSGENKAFGRVKAAGGWSGYCFKQYKFPRRWSSSSQMQFTTEQWQTAWQSLKMQLDADQLTILKRSRSGDVLAGQLTIGTRTLDVVIKRPRRRRWHRYLNEILREVRARRAWAKAWELIVRDIPTAWPLLVMQRQVAGYVTDALIVCERVEGPMLAKVDLDTLDESDRQRLFHRAGSLLRKMESSGLFHWDAKSVNFMVTMDPLLGPVPVLVDVDGIRHIRWTRSGIERLLRSLRDHAQYTPLDSYHACRGYAPHARLTAEDEQVDDQQEDQPDDPHTANADCSEIGGVLPGQGLCDEDQDRIAEADLSGNADLSGDNDHAGADPGKINHSTDDGQPPFTGALDDLAMDRNLNGDPADSNQNRGKQDGPAREPES